ncbi:hypothetical protein AAFF_G00126080 [Aldrovandia affinis]|uniref:B-cell lymphoma 3 protein n=1 Tax=Aldrovandia affinis TaxID=143900 RepID=A0AAD7RRF0_9TELE|nr:hypothetical protein AAFF_G00126080 [Aldrovandia affinis]
MTTSSQQTTATAVPLDLRTKSRHGKGREEDGAHPPEFEGAMGRNGHSVDNGTVKVEGNCVYPPGGPGRNNGTTVERLPVSTNDQEDRRPAMVPYQSLPAIAPYILYQDYPVLHPSMIINVPIMPLPFPYNHIEDPNRLSGDIAMATRQDDDGDTALHIAVVKGHEVLVNRLIQILVQANKDLDIYNNLRQTPLHLAVITNQVPLVEALLCAGSDPAALDRHGQTAAHLCCEHGLATCLQLVLSHTSRLHCLEARNYEGLTPLHLAVQNRSKKLVKLLLDSRVDIDAVDIKSGRSPLIHAVENNSMEMISFLIENGCNVNAQSYSGNTALHSACGRGQVEVVRALLRNGADSSLKNYHNDTALMVANNKKVTDVLRGKGSRSQNPKPLEDSTDPPSPNRRTPLSRQHSANGTPVQSPSHTFHRNNFFHRTKRVRQV